MGALAEESKKKPTKSDVDLPLSVDPFFNVAQASYIPSAKLAVMPCYCLFFDASVVRDFLYFR